MTCSWWRGKKKIQLQFFIIGGNCHKYHFCRDKGFVAASILLYLRRVLSQQTRVCRDKPFVAIKMILVAAPANDNIYAVHIDE